MGILGQDRKVNSGYKLNHGSYYFECLEVNSDHPAEEGELGRIVITDLFNYAFPMIRYDTGDMGILVKPENEWSFFKEVYGKQRDVIFNTNGEPITPSFFGICMWDLRGAEQWQFIQESINKYCIKINGRPDESINGIILQFKDMIGANADIRVEYVDEIPVLNSGKRRNTVSMLND